MTEHTVDATAEEFDAPNLEQAWDGTNPPALPAVRPARELVDRLTVIREAMNTAMQRDVDYGVIPGTDKPTLYKPGSEKLSVLFQLDVQLANEKRWGPGDHLTVESHATVFHAPTGSRLGYGEGIASTRERKHAYRTAQRVCPECGAPAIFKSKPRADGSGGKGWYCWSKKGGCGAQFANDDDPRIVSQETGDVENPDLPDLWNTVVKMAEKRARIDAVLAVTGASALFTQDLDDQATPADERPAEGTEAPSGRVSSSEPPSPKQLDYLKSLITREKPDENVLRTMLKGVGAHGVDPTQQGWSKALKRDQVSQLIEVLKGGILPTGESDIPSDPDPVPSSIAEEAGDLPWSE
jgi:hypothetical protein